VASSQHARAHPGGFQESIAYPVLWPLRYAVIWSLLLLNLALIALSLNLLFAKQVWPAGTALAHLEALLSQSASVSPNLALTDAFAEGVYWLFFGVTGIHDQVLGIRDTALLRPLGSASLLASMREELSVAMLAAKLFGTRLATAVSALPLFLLAFTAFTLDGLAERLIRKACGGRESATLYHLAKHSHFALLPVLLAIYLCVPVHIDPLWIVMPAILVSGSLLRLQAKYFKKHV
jgi:integrating conjugative element membrane protein (TIGR03747 family)